MVFLADKYNAKTVFFTGLDLPYKIKLYDHLKLMEPGDRLHLVIF
jgi:hypothetical protein